MRRMMRGIAMGLLAVTAVIAAQTALAGILGFHTAEVIGKAAITALYLYAVMRMLQKSRAKREG